MLCVCVCVDSRRGTNGVGVREFEFFLLFHPLPSLSLFLSFDQTNDENNDEFDIIIIIIILLYYTVIMLVCCCSCCRINNFISHATFNTRISKRSGMRDRTPMGNFLFVRAQQQTLFKYCHYFMRTCTIYLVQFDNSQSFYNFFFAAAASASI